MAKKREKIVVSQWFATGSWGWQLRSRFGECYEYGDGWGKERACNRARAFAAKFINPPDVVVEE